MYTLHQVKYSEEKEKPGKAIFAAKTKEEQAKLKTYTFTDNYRKFLIRIIFLENTTKLYLFSLTETVIENITLKTLPGGEEFFMNDNNAPLVIDKRIDVESIELKVGE